MKEKEIFKLEGEIWRDVVGYEGLYQVSNFGRVASLNYHREGICKLMKPKYDKYGYLEVGLFKDGKKDFFKIHTLVGMAFQDICGTYFEGAEIDHINTVRDDNRACNLRWCTRSENQMNPITNKRRSETQKNRKDLSKPVLQFDLEGNFIAEYQSISEASRQIVISVQAISMCCRGKTKSAGGSLWKIKEINNIAV